MGDPKELRGLAEAAHVPSRVGWGWDMARCADDPLGDQVRLYLDPPEVRYVAAVPPDVVLALLDRIDALEANQAPPKVCDCGRELVPMPDHPPLWCCPPCGGIHEFPEPVVTHYGPLPDPGAVAGEPESEETT